MCTERFRTYEMFDENKDVIRTLNQKTDNTMAI